MKEAVDTVVAELSLQAQLARNHMIGTAEIIADAEAQLLGAMHGEQQKKRHPVGLLVAETG
jgi:hypothetical protein